MTNQEIANVLREMSICYEMDGVAFKPAAYERAADAFAAAHEQAEALFAAGGRKELFKIEGVGEAISKHVEKLLKTGSFAEYRACKKRYPMDLLLLTSVDEVGAKRAKLLYQKLKVKTLADLERAVKSGQLSKLPGLGTKTEEKIRQSLARLRTATGRHPLGEVLPLAERMVSELRAVRGVKHAEVAGSVRRRQATIGDIDILVTTSQPEKVMAVFTGFPEVTEVLEHGPTKTTVRLANGMQADVRVIDDESFGAALQYFTGDKNHNVTVRKMAIAKGLKLNEYGIWRGKKRLASRTEDDVYEVLGMNTPPPTSRFDTGEIEAAVKAFGKKSKRKR